LYKHTFHAVPRGELFELIVSPHDRTVKELGNATFKCSVGVTPSTITSLLWEKDKLMVIRDSSRVTISEIQKNVTSQFLIVRIFLDLSSIDNVRGCFVIVIITLATVLILKH